MRKITEVNNIKVDVSLSLDQVIMILADWLEKNPKVDPESLTYVSIRNIATNFVADNGYKAVLNLNGKLLLKKRDIMAACKGIFAE